MKTNISDIIDLEKLDSLLEGFNKTTGFVTAILDLQGNLLSKSGWRQICTDFHRAHPECAKRCTFSDTVLAEQMEKGEKYHVYNCLNGLTDVVVPLKISGQHVANLFSGQFFFEEPDIDFFRKQAATFGFDEKEYITALRKVPIVSQEQVKTAMDFLLQMTDLISELGYEKMEQAELNKSLIESENKYRTIFNSTGTVTMLVRNNTYIEMANNEAERVTGFTDEELTGSKWTDHVAPHSLEKMLHYHKMRRTNSETAPGQYEVDLIHKSGETHRALLTIGMIPHSELSIVTLIDITERYKANQKLQESEEKFRALYDNAPLSYQSLNEDGSFKDVNPTWLSILGYDRDEVIGKFYKDFLHPDYKPHFEKNFHAFKKNGYVHDVQFKIRHKDGHYLDISFEGCVGYNPDGSFKQTYCVFQDITERKRAEEKILKQNKEYEALNEELRQTNNELIHTIQREKESNDRFNKAMEAVSDGLFDWNLITNEIYYSPRWKSILGYEESELPNDLSIWEQLTDPADVKRSMDMLNALIDGKKEKFDIEFKMKHKKGHWVDINSRANVFRDNEGKAVRVVGTHTDITARKESEKKLQESEEKYAELIENMTNAVAIFQVINDGKDFIFRDFNKAGEKTENIKREELIGKKVTEIFPAVKESGLFEVFQKVWKTGQPQNHPVTMYKENRITGWQENYIYKLSSGEIITVYEDITESKQTEAALKESELKYRQLFETKNEAVIFLDAESKRFIDVNNAACELYGYTKEEMLNLTAKDISAEVKDTYKVLDSTVVSDGNHRVTIRTHRRKNQEIIIVETSNTVFSLKNKKIICSTHRDITERRKAEAELAKLSTAVQQSPATIAITDTQGRLEYVNPKFTELTGYSLEEATGQCPSILKSGEHHDEMYKELWETISSGKTWRGEFHNKKKNGELFWESVSLSPIYDEQGKIIKYIKVAEDITERKRNEQIQKIVHNISNAVISSHNLEDFIQLVKDELGEIIDTTNFYIALYDEDTDYISLPFHHDEKDKIKSFPAGKTLTNYVIKTGKPLLATKAIAEGLEQAGKVEQIGHPSEVWLGVPLKSKNKLTGIFAVQSYDNENAYDESDVKILEIISHQISLSLERLKAEENLKHAVEQAQESDRLKSAFLANMSHEIRTPMNGILGFTNLLKESQLTGNEKDEYIRIIEKSGNRMLNTINDIVDISKIEAGQVEVVKSKVSVNKLLEEHYNFFQREAKSKGLEISYKTCFPDNDSHIITDLHKLEGILTNLIKNAIKYTEAGNITFGCSLRTLKEKDFVEFYVKDTGIGIPEDRVNAIFNRFEQADIEDSRVFQGSGLGLAISKSYVEMLGGEVSVKSKEKEGSIFTFSIPYVNQDTDDQDTDYSAEKQSENKNMQTSVKNASVIIAEDDKDSQLFLRTVLTDLFDHIICTTTGEETIEALKKNPSADIILMDIKMPGMNGYDATSEIRKFNQNIKIIAQTAYGLSCDDQIAIDAGCDDYIPKPIKKELLLEKIRACMDKTP